MKNILFFTVITLLCACQSTEVDGYKELSIRTDKRNTDNLAPGVVPAEAGINQLAHDTSSTWKDFDQFYRNADTKFEGELYLDNAKWMAIEYMVLYCDFNAAPSDVKKFYLDEVVKRKFVNNPIVIQKMITDSDFLSPKDVAKLAFEVCSINVRHMENNETLRNAHQEKYKDAYFQLQQLGMDRWGQPLYEKM